MSNLPMSTYYFVCMQSLRNLMEINKGEHTNFHDDIKQAFQDNLISEEEKQKLLDEIDQLLNNNMNYMASLSHSGGRQVRRKTSTKRTRRGRVGGKKRLLSRRKY